MDQGQNSWGTKKVNPFLKWAGGKRWLTSGFSDIFPDSYNTYIEPFLGSGAVFFQLNPNKAILSDSNADLVNTYEAIRTNHCLVKRYLSGHQKSHSKEHYYDMRSKTSSSKYVQAARFIYLNRTCWNALYRVNLKGEFNVPIGTKTSVLRKDDNFLGVAGKLSNASLRISDFEPIIKSAKKGDFLFVDPPYTVKHNLNGFVKYNEKIFTWSDQIRLCDSLVGASDRGVLVLMTNANHESIREIYKENFSIETKSRKSVIAASASNRSITTELLVSNFR